MLYRLSRFSACEDVFSGCLVCPTLTISDQNHSEIDHFYHHQTPKKTFWLCKGTRMLKLGRVRRQTGEKFVDPTKMSRLMRAI